MNEWFSYTIVSRISIIYISIPMKLFYFVIQFQWNYLSRFDTKIRTRLNKFCISMDLIIIASAGWAEWNPKKQMTSNKLSILSKFFSSFSFQFERCEIVVSSFRRNAVVSLSINHKRNTPLTKLAYPSSCTRRIRQIVLAVRAHRVTRARNLDNRRSNDFPWLNQLHKLRIPGTVSPRPPILRKRR